MADPCLGCGTEIDSTTQKLKIKGATSQVWDVSYGASAEAANGLHCDPNTSNLWAPPPSKAGVLYVPPPTSWQNVTAGTYSTWQHVIALTGTYGPQAVATSGTATVTNTTTEPLVARVDGGAYLVAGNIGADNITSGVRFFVSVCSAPGSCSSLNQDVLVATNAGNRVATWSERIVGMWIVPVGGSISVQYQPWYSQGVVTNLGTGGIVNLAGWGDTQSYISYWTARSV